TCGFRSSWPTPEPNSSWNSPTARAAPPGRPTSHSSTRASKRQRADPVGQPFSSGGGAAGAGRRPPYTRTPPARRGERERRLLGVVKRLDRKHLSGAPGGDLALRPVLTRTAKPRSAA